MNTTLRAVVWMSGAIISFSIMAVAGRELKFALDTYEIMLYRSLIGIVVVVSVGAALGTLRQIKTDRMALHSSRNLAHFIGQNLWFYALTTEIALAQVFALEFTSPLWAIVLTPLLLGDKLTRTNMLAGLAGFIGILIVARPGVTEINAGTVTAASAAIFFALTAIATRKLTSNQSITCILFWLTVLQAIFGLICAGWDFDIALPDAQALPFVIAIGLGGLCAHLCITQALSMAPPTVVMPLDFVRLPLIAVVAYLLYEEKVEVWIFAGAILIFAANYANVLEAHRANKQRVSKAT